MIDTVRIAELNNELGVVQDTIQRAQERRHAIVRELVDLLNKSAAEGADGTSPQAELPATGQGVPPSSPSSATASAAVSLPPGDGSPATFFPLIPCPECSDLVKPKGIGTHRRMKHGVTGRHTRLPGPAMAECPECRKEVKAGGLGTHRRQAHGRGRQTVLVKPPPEPEPAESETVVRSTTPWQPRPEVVRSGPETIGGKERWLCARCPSFFNSEDARDRHQATHPSIDPPLPTGGQRIRRTPPNGGYAPATSAGAGE